MTGATFTLPPELVEQIAVRAAELLAERHAPAADGWLRGAQQIADYIGSTRSRVYSLTSCTPPRIPVEHDGAAIVAKRSTLDTWITTGGGRCPAGPNHNSPGTAKP